MFSGEGVNQLRDVEAAGDAVQVVLQRQEVTNGLGLSNDIEVAASGQHQQAMSKKLHVAAQLAVGTPCSLGYRLQFAQVGRVESQDSIGFAQLGALDDNGFCLVYPGRCHGLLYAVTCPVFLLEPG